MSLGVIDDRTPFKTAVEIFVDEQKDGWKLAGETVRLTGEQFLASLEHEG